MRVQKQYLSIVYNIPPLYKPYYIMQKKRGNAHQQKHFQFQKQIENLYKNLFVGMVWPHIFNKQIKIYT